MNPIVGQEGEFSALVSDQSYHHTWMGLGTHGGHSKQRGGTNTQTSAGLCAASQLCPGFLPDDVPPIHLQNLFDMVNI